MLSMSMYHCLSYICDHVILPHHSTVIIKSGISFITSLRCHESVLTKRRVPEILQFWAKLVTHDQTLFTL